MIPLKDNLPTGRLPLVTLRLTVVNFVAYILAVSHGGSFISGPDVQQQIKYSAIPFALTHPSYHRRARSPRCSAATSSSIPAREC